MAKINIRYIAPNPATLLLRFLVQALLLCVTFGVYLPWHVLWWVRIITESFEIVIDENLEGEKHHFGG